MQRFLLYQEKQLCRGGQNYQKESIGGGKDEKVFFGLLGVEKSEFTEGDKTCQGGNEGSRAADVNAQQQSRVVGCEAGEEDCRGNVAYCLAGEGGN